MRISVCIATYNRQKTLAQTLPTILEQDFPGHQFEVVIVDDGSTDHTAEFLSGLRASCVLRVLRQPNRGQAAAQNAALHAAQGELVLLLDDDILCDPRLLREHDAGHAGTEPRFVFGPILVADESPPTLVTEWAKADIRASLQRLDNCGPQWPNDALADANCSAPRAAFLQCGGMDERLITGSNSARTNADLGLRLWKMGLRFHFRPEAVVRQIHVKTARDLIFSDARWYGRNEVLLSRKHPEYRPHSPLASLGRGSFLRRLIRKVIATTPVSPDVLLHLPFWLTERGRAIPSIRRAGVHLLKIRMGIATYRGALREFGPWEALISEFGRRLPVLIYHHVGPSRPGTYPELTVSARKFEQHVNWLARHGYIGIRPSDWFAWCRQGSPLPSKPVLLTFDDAYQDLVDHAFPVLRRYGFGAAVYVVTSQLDGTNVWDQTLGCGVHRLMGSRQIQMWADQGIEFGAHSRTHADLTKLSGAALEDEIRGSCEDLGKVLGRKISSFAYPYGYYNEAVRIYAEHYCDGAFTVEEGVNDLGTDLHRMRRTMVGPNDSLSRFASRVRFGWTPFMHLRSRLRLRTRLRQFYPR